MQTQISPTREDILAIVATMTREQLALLYEVATAIRQRAIAPAVDDVPDFLQATEEELAAEDALWATMTAKHADKLAKISERITNEIEADETLPMFDDKGRWLVDEQIEAEQVKA